jgi:soluble lytic murein transglycosylase-like protein
MPPMPLTHLFRPALRRTLPLLLPLALGPGVAQSATTDAASSTAPAAQVASATVPGAASAALAVAGAPAAGVLTGPLPLPGSTWVSVPASAASATSDAHAGDGRRVTDMLMKKFGVARQKAQRISTAVMQSASKYSLPPALLLAIISIESRFKENARGGHGATGLMQVVPSAHRQLVRNIDLTEPEPNIDAGSAILHGYLQSARGDVKAALKSYGGSNAYAEKVTSTAQRFEPAVAVSEAAAGQFDEATLPSTVLLPH